MLRDLRRSFTYHPGSTWCFDAFDCFFKLSIDSVRRRSRNGWPYGDQLCVWQLWVDPERRGQGNASNALRMLTGYADTHGVELYLWVSADPFDRSGGIARSYHEADELRAWYGRRGFELETEPGGVWDDPPALVRAPRGRP